MFQTLRHVNSGNGPYVLETMCAPFDKKSQNKTTRLACDRCRSKKVKCITEEGKGACQRCLERCWTCSYSSPSKPGSRSRQSSSDPAMLTTPPIAATARIRSGSNPMGDGIIHSIDSGTDSSHEPSSYDILDMDMDIENDFIAGSQFDMAGALGDILSSHPQHGEGPPSTFDTASSILSGPSQAPSRGSHATSAGSGQPRASVCPRCSSSTMLRTYETVEICLVWGPRDPSGAMSLGADERLQCQKEALSNCESWLGCDTCSLQPEQALLIISICNKVLTSIIDLKEWLLDQARQDSESSARSAVSVGASRWTTPPGTSQPRGGGVDGRCRPSNFDVPEWKWKMDDEDRLHVLKILVDSRVARLKVLTHRLEEIAASNRWQVHRSMIRDTKQRLGNLEENSP